MDNRQKLHNFVRMLGFLKGHRVKYLIGLIVYTCQTFVSMFVISLFMGGIMGAILNQSTSELYATLIRVSLLFLGFMLAVAIGVYLFYISQAHGYKTLQAKLFTAFVRSDLEDASSKHSGEGIAALNIDADRASDVIGDALARLMFNVQGIVFSLITIFVIDYRLGFGAIGIGIVAFIIQISFAPALARIGKEQLEANADSTKEMSNIFSGGLALRALGRQQKALVMFDKENGRLRFAGFRQAFISMWQNLFTTVQGWLSLVLVFALGGYLVATGRLGFDALVMVPMMAMAVTESIGQFGQSWAGLQAPFVATERVLKIIDSAPPEYTAKKVVTWDGKYDIKLDNVNFAYKGAEKNALTDISLEIGENEMVAFVGESGSGKSTLLRLIIGMYQRDELGMSVGNLEYANGDMPAWRERFAYVDQSCKLFDMTIGENIAMGLRGSATQEQIKKAAVEAFADDFIMEQPDGYDSDCGEKGATLSGGQRQRIAIARALIKGAPVMVFDEATSALDTESEQRIMESIETFRGNHTILITTHNLRNVVNADKIVVLDSGCVVEVGAHDELMARGGVYAGLVGN